MLKDEQKNSLPFEKRLWRCLSYACGYDHREKHAQALGNDEVREDVLVWEEMLHALLPRRVFAASVVSVPQIQLVHY